MLYGSSVMLYEVSSLVFVCEQCLRVNRYEKLFQNDCMSTRATQCNLGRTRTAQYNHRGTRMTQCNHRRTWTAQFNTGQTRMQSRNKDDTVKSEIEMDGMAQTTQMRAPQIIVHSAIADSAILNDKFAVQSTHICRNFTLQLHGKVQSWIKKDGIV